MICLEAARVPTMYFIGVTTTQSSIMRLFPKWANYLGLHAELKGIDLPLDTSADDYRRVVEHIKADPLSYGALVTTHKINLLTATKHLFDQVDDYAHIFGEISCIAKKEGKLVGFAKDPITCGLAMKSFVPDDFWSAHKGNLCVLGAGGSARAIAAYLLNENQGRNRPSAVVISDCLESRLAEFDKIYQRLAPRIPLAKIRAGGQADNDRAVEDLPPYSMVVNATGVGKDVPGSPLSDQCRFPQHSIIWELNYRGALTFLKQALAQRSKRRLEVHDGWSYFIHGWTQVIAEVFEIDLTKDTLDNIMEISHKTL